jgi:hypothetical protein
LLPVRAFMACAGKQDCLAMAATTHRRHMLPSVVRRHARLPGIVDCDACSATHIYKIQETA